MFCSDVLRFRRLLAALALTPIARRIRFAPWIVCLLLVMASTRNAGAESERDSVHGLLFTRLYSFEEIGNIPRGPRLGFDRFGRLTVMAQGSYLVLNDSTWLDMAERDPAGVNMINVIPGNDGHFYYGAFGNWGRVEYTSTGLLRRHSLVPATAPKWILASNFADLLATRDGVYFSGFYGVVFCNSKTEEQQFFDFTGVGRVFSIRDRVYLCSNLRGLYYINIQTHALQPIAASDLGDATIERWTPWDDDHVLISTGDGQLLLFDGREFKPWPNRLPAALRSRVSEMQRLLDGNIAIAITGAGLYILTPEGEIVSALTSPEYQRITYLVAREKGVLWACTENGVEKILYGTPVSLFGQRLGLPVSWPQLVRWRDRIVVASGGRLYESMPGQPGGPTQFQRVADQPTGEVWGIAASGSRLLVGNSSGIFEREENGSFVPVLMGVDVSRLVMIGSDFCYYIGTNAIGALRWENGRWAECAPRIAGVGYPSYVVGAGRSAWLELGANRAARISFRDGKLHSRVFETFPWNQPRWINIGVLGKTVILSGPPEGRIYFDEDTEREVDGAALRSLFDEAPYWIARVREGEDGTIWASDDHGVMAVRRRDGRFALDLAAFSMVDDRYPWIHILPGNDVWFSAGQSLYHVDREVSAIPESLSPRLVSISDARTNQELYSPGSPRAPELRLPYANNSLNFRFFAGGYTLRRSPLYEVRLNGVSNSWTNLGTGSLLTLTNLREGNYQLEVKLTDNGRPVGETLSLPFIIDPPWYRTFYAFALYILGVAAGILLFVRWTIYRTRAQNRALEKLVAERTEALRAAMEKLNEEARNAATLAERGRLAGEIHDSLQQGLSGLILQLDATLKLPSLTPDVRSRISTARNMVSFSRHEVQNAIWDLESPLLEGVDLTQALQKLINLINVGPARVDFTVSGTPHDLSQAVKHHLMRIVQEALTNAVRHAEPSTIFVKLVYENDAVEVRVTDDGKGFETANVLGRTLGHFGLRGLKVRADKMGAILQIVSEPGRGTTVCIVVPLGAKVPTEIYATGPAV